MKAWMVHARSACGKVKQFLVRADSGLNAFVSADKQLSDGSWNIRVTEAPDYTLNHAC